MNNKAEIINHGDYYSYRGQLYIKQFPQMWATSHAAETGPEECDNCSFHGSWNGVFIGYCMNCAEYTYDFQRGHGFIEHGEEQDLDIPQLRAIDTYLYGVDLDVCINVSNDGFYQVDLDSDDEEEGINEYKKYRKNDEQYIIKNTPITEKSCDVCAIGI